MLKVALIGSDTKYLNTQILPRLARGGYKVSKMLAWDAKDASVIPEDTDVFLMLNQETGKSLHKSTMNVAQGRGTPIVFVRRSSLEEGMANLHQIATKIGKDRASRKRTVTQTTSTGPDKDRARDLYLQSHCHPVRFGTAFRTLGLAYQTERTPQDQDAIINFLANPSLEDIPEILQGQSPLVFLFLCMITSGEKNRKFRARDFDRAYEVITGSRMSGHYIQLAAQMAEYTLNSSDNRGRPRKSEKAQAKQAPSNVRSLAAKVGNYSQQIERLKNRIRELEATKVVDVETSASVPVISWTKFGRDSIPDTQEPVLLRLRAEAGKHNHVVATLKTAKDGFGDPVPLAFQIVIPQNTVSGTLKEVKAEIPFQSVESWRVL